MCFEVTVEMFLKGKTAVDNVDEGKAWEVIAYEIKL